MGRSPVQGEFVLDQWQGACWLRPLAVRRAARSVAELLPSASAGGEGPASSARSLGRIALWRVGWSTARSRRERRPFLEVPPTSPRLPEVGSPPSEGSCAQPSLILRFWRSSSIALNGMPSL